MMKTNESGRSMVEMLGVLAIIGVLSVGGIAGYTMAMNRYRANEAIDLANKFAIVVHAGRQTRLAMGQGEYTTVPTLENSGLIEGGNIPNNVQITIPGVNSIDDNGVTLNINFGAEGPCRAARNILGVDTACAGNALNGIRFNASGGATGAAAEGGEG